MFFFLLILFPLFVGFPGRKRKGKFFFRTLFLARFWSFGERGKGPGGRLMNLKSAFPPLPWPF